MKLTQERLKELLDYNPETGNFTWKVDRSRIAKKGSIAGFLNNRGYYHIGINGKNYKAHRLAFLYMEGYFPENDIDHINRKRSDNKWNNLREASRSCNVRNSKVREDSKSGITGVCWHKESNKWLAQIRMPKAVHLGIFSSIIDAARARWEAEVKYNFPNCNTSSSAYMYLKSHNKI